jgi:hypothetical protein
MAIRVVHIKGGNGLPITRDIDSNADHSGLPNNTYFTQQDLSGLVRYKNTLGVVVDAYTAEANAIHINEQADLDQFFNTNRYDIPANTKLRWNTSITSPYYINFLGDNTLVEGIGGFAAQFIYAGTGGAFRGTDGNVSLTHLTIACVTSGGKCFDFTNTGKTKTFFVEKLVIANQDTAGTVVGYNIALASLCNFSATSNGLIFQDGTNLYLQQLGFDGTNTGTFISVPSGSYTNGQIIQMVMNVAGGSTGININAGVTFSASLLLQGSIVVGAGTKYTGLSIYTSFVRSRANTGIENNNELEPKTTAQILALTGNTNGRAFFNTDLSTPVWFAGTNYVQPKEMTPLFNVLFEEKFESGNFTANGWTVVNDTVNLWQVGTAQKFDGTYGAYISNDGGTTANYTNNAAKISHFYKDIAIPAEATTLKLIFYWKCQGEVGFDRGRIFDAPTSITPVAGTEVSATYRVGLLEYNNSSAGFNRAEINLTPNAGTTRRFIFSWVNDGSLGTNPAMCIDFISLQYL